jgi:LAO/AO transport system kinase
MDDLKDRLLKGDKRAAARLISIVENDVNGELSVVKELYHKTGNAYVIGITGPPGAGKSTLTDKLVKEYRKSGYTVGVIAIDPTSPFTGGALLGDRVRMSDLNTDSGVFIRSMGARGHLGGVSEATGAAVDVLDIYGCDYIFVETVGVGQSEVDIVKNCDTTVLVSVPGLGDEIQTIKAGIMEIGDVFVVNKADRDGAQRTAREIAMMLEFKQDDWLPTVNMAVATDNSGIPEVLDEIERHREFMLKSGRGHKRRVANRKEGLIQLVKERVTKLMLDRTYNGEFIDRLSERIVAREVDPYTAADQIMDKLNRLYRLYISLKIVINKILLSCIRSHITSL